MTSHGSRMSGGSTESSDLKKLKSKYSSQLSTLKELFTDWTDDDLLFAIQDANGDLEVAVDRISEGKLTHFSFLKIISFKYPFSFMFFFCQRKRKVKGNK